MYKRNYPGSFPLFRELSVKKGMANFCVAFEAFHNLPSVLLSLLIFVTECFDKHFLTRLMVHRGYFFMNFLLIDRSRLLALIDCICGTEICG